MNTMNQTMNQTTNENDAMKPGRLEERRRPGRVITPEEGLRNREQLVRAIKEMQRQQRLQRQAYGRRG